MMKLALWLSMLLALPLAAQGATLPVINGNGQLTQMNMQADASGNLSPRNTICDGTNPDNCAPVSVTAGMTVLPNQPSAAALNMTAFQGNQSSFNATVFQPLGSSLHVAVDSCIGCGGTGNTGIADESAFSFGTTLQLPAGCVYQTVATSNALSSGQAGSIQCTANRAGFSNLRNASGTEIGTSSNPVQVSIANTGANGTAIIDTATISQSGSALSATNGLFTNLLQSNAVISAGNPIYVAQVPLTANGLTPQSAIVANNTTSVAVGSSAAHQLYAVDGFSISSATPVYVKFYNAAQGSTTCGSGTPVLRYVISAAGGTGGSGEIMHDANGVAFGTALTYCVTAGIADNDTTAPAASTYVLNLLYK